MNEVIKIAVFAMLGVVVLLILRTNSNTFTIIAEIGIVLLLLFLVVPYINDLFYVIEDLQFITNSSNTAIKIMIKAFIVLMVGSVTADICRDNSAGAVASVVEASVKLLALSLSLPVFSAVIEVVSAVFNG